MIVKGMPLNEAFEGGNIRLFASQGEPSCGGILKACGFDISQETAGIANKQALANGLTGLVLTPGGMP